jgi:hypothetical protein
MMLICNLFHISEQWLNAIMSVKKQLINFNESLRNFWGGSTTHYRMKILYSTTSFKYVQICLSHLANHTSMENIRGDETKDVRHA